MQLIRSIICNWSMQVKIDHSYTTVYNAAGKRINCIYLIISLRPPSFLCPPDMCKFTKLIYIASCIICKQVILRRFANITKACVYKHRKA